MLLVSGRKVVGGIHHDVSWTKGSLCILHQAASSCELGARRTSLTVLALRSAGLCILRIAWWLCIQIHEVHATSSSLPQSWGTRGCGAELPPCEGDVHEHAEDDHLNRKDEVLPSAGAAGQRCQGQQKRLPEREKDYHLHTHKLQQWPLRLKRLLLVGGPVDQVQSIQSHAVRDVVYHEQRPLVVPVVELSTCIHHDGHHRHDRFHRDKL
mmetsp:Transcript_3774/g.8996  ORF Transcript_3774/g.8996 Transcript_3774/m.8996 type:complete len:210 (-) Transcript_3774:2-631(-)